MGCWKSFCHGSAYARGRVSPTHFVLSCFSLRPASNGAVYFGGRADGMLSGAAIGGSIINLLQLSAAAPFLSTTSWQVLRNLLA